jgi:hypothetical protein
MSHASNEKLLSPTKLANHLSCAHLTQLDLQRARGELKIEFVPDARLAGHDRAWPAVRG